MSGHKTGNSRIRSIITCSLMLILSFLQFSCMPKTISVEPLRSEVPIQLFDRYELSLYGYDSRGGGFILYCDPYFLTKVPEGTNSDSIPILIIDTMCFSADCLSDEVCLRLESWHQMDVRLGVPHNSFTHGEPMSGYDLWVRHEVIIPSGFYTENSPYFLSNCYGSGITVEIKARILDRDTHMQVAKETKKVNFEITAN